MYNMQTGKILLKAATRNALRWRALPPKYRSFSRRSSPYFRSQVKVLHYHVRYNCYMPGEIFIFQL